MKRSVRNLILAILMGSALFVAGLSSDANGNAYENFGGISAETQIKFFAEENPKRDSEFWSKFRDSVMPDDKNSSGQGGKGTDVPQNPAPPNSSRNKAM